MAQGNAGHGFILTLLKFGFGVMAFAFFKQREELHKHGYDLEAMSVPGLNFAALTPVNRTAIVNYANNPNDPANVIAYNALSKAEKEFAKDLSTWVNRNSHEKDKLYLINSATAPTVASIKGFGLPALIKHGNNVYAATTASKDPAAPGYNATGVNINPLTPAALAAAPYKDLVFPTKVGRHKSLDAATVVAKLKTDYNHIRVAHSHVNRDSHLDRRMLVVRDGNGHFISLMQAADGQYKYSNVNANPNLLAAMQAAQDNFSGTETKPANAALGVDRTLKTKRLNNNSYSELIDATVADAHGAHAAVGGVESANKKYTPAEKAKLLARAKNMMLSTGAIAASKFAIDTAKRFPDMYVQDQMYKIRQGGDYKGKLTEEVRRAKDFLRIQRAEPRLNYIFINIKLGCQMCVGSSVLIKTCL